MQTREAPRNVKKGFEASSVARLKAERFQCAGFTFVLSGRLVCCLSGRCSVVVRGSDPVAGRLPGVPAHVDHPRGGCLIGGLAPAGLVAVRPAFARPFVYLYPYSLFVRLPCFPSKLKKYMAIRIRFMFGVRCNLETDCGAKPFPLDRKANSMPLTLVTFL